MNGGSILSMLEPLRDPAPVSWWPPAPGWWLLAALACAILVYVARIAFRRWRRGAALRQARHALGELKGSNLEPISLVNALGVLQRRLCIATCGRKACAGLTGEAWIAFLNSRAAGQDDCFSADLADLAFRPDPAADQSEALLDATERWLGKYKISA
ncbi:MAG: DUF4381 domain-containing protein [Pseudomonadota bacterium]